MPQYQGKNATIVRQKAQQGDPGFKDDGTEQVVIRTEDGQEKAVPRDQLKN